MFTKINQLFKVIISTFSLKNFDETLYLELEQVTGSLI